MHGFVAWFTSYRKANIVLAILVFGGSLSVAAQTGKPAKPGWYVLTGDKQNVDFALNKLGQYVNDKQDHLNIFIIGNERTGLWKKAFGLARSDELVKVVESVLNDQPPGSK